MTRTFAGCLAFQFACAVLLCINTSIALSQEADPLPSWNGGAAKQAIVGFVARVIREGSPDFVPSAQRIAVFDNDGTLWCEQPFYFQGLFALDRVRAMAPNHPEWRTIEPFKSILSGDKAGLAATGEKGLLQVIAATHAGMTTGEFDGAVGEWLKTTVLTRNAFTFRCSNCSRTCGRTGSRPSSSREVGSSSYVSSRRRLMASRPSRSLAAAA